MVEEKFHIYGVKITSKYICDLKKFESVHFYSCPLAKLSPRFLSLTPRQKEITHSSIPLFFPTKKKGGGGGGVGARIIEQKK